MSCPSQDEITLLLDEQLSVERAREIEAHVSGCRSCRERRAHVEALTRAIAAPAPAGMSASAFTARVLARIELDAPPVRRPWRFALAAAALLAVVPLALWVLARTGGPDESGIFQPRGANLPAAWRDRVGVEPLLVQGRSWRPLPRNAILGSDEGLAFRYTNLTSERLYLLAFALDARREIHWLHPAWLDAAEDPASVPLEPQARALALSQVARPDACPPGPLRVVAVMSQRQRHVQAVEAALRRERAIPSAFEGDAVQEWHISCGGR
jgi:hypothetical protein